MPYRLMEPRFPLGEVYASAAAAERLAQDSLLKILHRHHCGDWGDLGEGDKRANEEAIQTDERILSRYNLECGSFSSKGAMDTLTIGLAGEVAGEGIRVNAVRPAFIETDIHAKGGEPGRLDRLKDAIPLKRGGKPEEVAAAILWLLTDESSHSTGGFIDVAGGK